MGWGCIFSLCFSFPSSNFEKDSEVDAKANKVIACELKLKLSQIEEHNAQFSKNCGCSILLSLILPFTVSNLVGNKRTVNVTQTL